MIDLLERQNTSIKSLDFFYFLRRDDARSAIAALVKRRHAGPLSKRSHAHSKSRRSPPPTNSFASAPIGSHGLIQLPKIKRESPVFKAFLVGFCGVFLLVVFGGSHHVAALGLALILSGTALLIHPPIRGLGKQVIPLCLITALLSHLFLSFILGRLATRRGRVVRIGATSSLSVQPLLFRGLAYGFGWFRLALRGFTIEDQSAGSSLLILRLSILLSVIAGAVVWGNLMVRAT